MATYTLLQTGPDTASTYPECWGASRTSLGRVVAEHKTLAGLIEAVSALDHDNWWIRGPGGKYIAGSRKEFFALPRVKNILKWAKDERVSA